MKIKYGIENIKEDVPLYFQKMTFTSLNNNNSKVIRVSEFPVYNSLLSECNNSYKPISRIYNVD